jgi:hypothetical protein
LAANEAKEPSHTLKEPSLEPIEVKARLSNRFDGLALAFLSVKECSNRPIDPFNSLVARLLATKDPAMTIESLLDPPLQTRTSYSPRQLRDRLATLREGMALHLPKDGRLGFVKNRLVPKQQLIAAIDAELAAFEAFDRLLVQVMQQRRQLQSRLPALATAVEQLSRALKYYGGTNRPLRRALGVAPGKKRRKLKPAERLAATVKLNLTRARTGTAAKKRRKR